jgi:hypothetical protein
MSDDQEDVSIEVSGDDTAKGEVGKQSHWGVVLAWVGKITVIVAATAVVTWFVLSDRDRNHLIIEFAPNFLIDIPGPIDGDTQFFDQPAMVHQFDLSNATIPIERILPGGPPKDGIPAITNPEFVKPAAADWMSVDDRVIGITIGNETRAYPLKILDQHEIVNDVVGETPVSVTYCPLCDSALVFDRRVDGETLELGVSGLLHNSNVLMYDRRLDAAKESLWSQLACKAIAGPLVGKELKTLPVELVTWKAWRERHPDTLVLSTETGFDRDYGVPVYGAYFTNDDLMFPVKPLDDRLPAKTPVVAVWAGGSRKAFTASAVLAGAKDGVLRTVVAGKVVELAVDPVSQSMHVSSAETGVEWAYSFWFAWAAFHPESELFMPTAVE